MSRQCLMKVTREYECDEEAAGNPMLSCEELSELRLEGRQPGNMCQGLACFHDDLEEGEMRPDICDQQHFGTLQIFACQYAVMQL